MMKTWSQNKFLHVRSSIIFHFLATCPLGKEVSRDGKNCMDCPTGTYKNTISSRYCVSCPSGTSTKVPGAAASSDCKCEYLRQPTFSELQFTC